LTWQVSGKLRRSEVRFGIDWRVLMPFAHPCRPLRAQAYAVGAAAPGLLLGVLPAIVGLTLGYGPLSGWGALFIAAATGDVLVLYTLRATSPHALVQDHPTRIGCEMVTID
jgi:hypothetical protein